MAVKVLGEAPDEDRAPGEDWDPKPAILVDEIAEDLCIGDLGLVKVPFVNLRSHLYPKPPVLPHEFPCLSRAQQSGGDLVECEGDLVV